MATDALVVARWKRGLGYKARHVATTTTRILLFADNPADRAEVQRLLHLDPARRFEIQEATTDRIGLADRRDPGGSEDCVLLAEGDSARDIADALAALAGRSGAPPCPVVVLTSSLERGRAALAAGAEEYLERHRWTTEALARAIDDALARYQASRRTHERDARFRLAMRTVTGVVWEWDTRTHEVHRSEGLRALIGIAPEDAAPTHAWWIERIHPEDLVRLAGLPHVAEVDRYASEYRVRHADGRWVHVWEHGVVERDASGRIARAVGFTADITQRKLAEAALAASERRFRELADAMPQVVWVADAAGAVTYYNRRVESFDGVVRRPDGTWDWQPILHPDDLAATQETWRAAAASLGPYQAEHRIRLLDGTYRWHLSRGTAVRGPEGEVTWYGTATDIHDLKLAEQALKDADRRKDEFLATLAHELRNPLASIQNGMEVLRRAPSSELAARARPMLDRQLAHLVRLVDDLLDVSRVISGKITLQPERVLVQELVAAAVETCRQLVDARGHALDVALPPAPLRLDGDRTRLTQVLVNLLNNAAKYTDPGGRIRLVARRDGPVVEVEVTDDGVGIAADVLPTIWGMFTQIRASLDRSQGGLGVGLALVKRLVEMHGGSVAADSPGPGRGSTFRVRLPLAEAESSAPRPAAPTPPTRSRRVLVVDDNVDAAETLSMLLDLLGHRATTVYSGPEALPAALREAPEIVFLDIGLPGMSGYEVAARLRAEPATAGALLVALTGWGTDTDLQRSWEAGFDRHLTKPVDVTALAEVLASERRGRS